ncbi:MAG: ATP-binding protein [Chlorobi bacterium]|nr:ATP-binding protein [Chlorobiota bacterium]
MFLREKLDVLDNWAKKEERKPLILRGARQVGKTTLIRMFAENFEQYIELNLEKQDDRRFFEGENDIKDIVKAIFLSRDKVVNGKKTLIFIDEIQNSPYAVKMLRYFYEDYGQLFVVAAGSLLESLLKFKESFPVGRIEYMYLYPFTFREFLSAKGKNGLIEALNEIPFARLLHDELLKNFSEYALIGGMPEIVKSYLKFEDIVEISPIYETLLVSYMEDVEKYAKSEKQKTVLRYVIRSSFKEAGKRIKFEGFGDSKYKYREVKDALATLEKAMLIQLLFPTVSTTPPISEKFRKSPKIHLLDTGLVNYFAGAQREFILNRYLEDIYSGTIAEHIVGQELFATEYSQFRKPTFWVKEKKQSNAEVDFVYQFMDMIIPVEVKAGKTGKLRSLMQFVDAAPHNFAVRVYSGKFSVENSKTIAGKKFKLLNLPFYLVGEINKYLERLINYSD